MLFERLTAATFGRTKLDWNSDWRQHEIRLYNTKELSDLTVRYKRETIKRDAVLTKCKSLLDKIKRCSESNDVFIATGSPVLPGISVKLHSETVEHYKRLHKEASMYQEVIETLQKEIVPFSQEGLARIIEQRLSYQPIFEILTMMDREGWSTEEQLREKEKQEDERIKQERLHKERLEQLALMAKQREEQERIEAAYRERRKKELEEEKRRWEEERPMREAKAKEERIRSEQIRSMLEEQKRLEEEREEPTGNVLLASSLCKKCRRQMVKGQCITCTRSTTLTELEKK